MEAEILAQRLERFEEVRAGLAARIGALTGGEVVVRADDRLAPPSRPHASFDAARGIRARCPSTPLGGWAGHAGGGGIHGRDAADHAPAGIHRGVNLNLSRMAFDRMYGQEPVMPAIGRDAAALARRGAGGGPGGGAAGDAAGAGDGDARVGWRPSWTMWEPAGPGARTASPGTRTGSGPRSGRRWTRAWPATRRGRRGSWSCWTPSGWRWTWRWT
jgi:hypothetical protein